MTEILSLLEKEYGGTGPALTFQTPFQLLVAVILSAQCTDVRVNKITEALFRDYPTAQAINAMSEQTLQEYIKSGGFYVVKSKHIKETANMIVEQFGGEVPSTREELMTLPGVGRKTANVVLSNAFHVPAFAVDTHIFRVARRLGLSDAKTPDGVEKDVTALLSEDKWGAAHHWLIWHGRRVCHARRPNCVACVVNALCPSKENYVRR